MIVVDASALVDVLFRSATSGAVEALLYRPGQSLHAPHLIDIEIAHVVRRLAIRGAIDPDRGRDAIVDLMDMPIRRYPHALLLPTVWKLRENVTAYDAVYVALADVLGATLVTRDRRLAKAVSDLVDVALV